MTKITRWDKWFSAENLKQDARILAAPPSRSAASAAQVFLAAGKGFVLDLACGAGRDMRYLAGCGLQVVGVDASLNGLRAAQQLRAGGNDRVPFVAADARQLPFKTGAFGGVYCYGLLHEFTGADRVRNAGFLLREIGRVLDPGGILVITALAGAPEAGLPTVQLYSRKLFLDIVRGWRVAEIREDDDVGCTGRRDYHIWYAVVQP